MSDTRDSSSESVITQGAEIYALAERLWPLNRSISGEGLRETLRILQEFVPELELIEVPSGTRAFDWTVPEEWEIREAWIEDEDGNRIIDFADNNLHLVGYSTGVDQTMSLDELQPHLHSLPEQPEAIPYVTSYYERNWGFCLSQNQREALVPGNYRVRIDARHFGGSITLAEAVFPGKTGDEVLFSTYCCHPSMANNELSGPCVAAALAGIIRKMPERRLSYRFVFVPETIGSLAYLSRNLESLKKKVISGFNLTCLGDERAWSYLPSRDGNTLADRVAQHCLKHLAPEFKRYEWRHRGSDERQYCAPGVDLPVASVMRSKYHEYPEYHTSLDRLGRTVTANGLADTVRLYKTMIEVMENNTRPTAVVLGEPQLGRRGLYARTSKAGSAEPSRAILELLTWADGTNDLIDIAERGRMPVWDLLGPLQILVNEGLVDCARTQEASGRRPHSYLVK